jgi:hypothetical protein
MGRLQTKYLLQISSPVASKLKTIPASTDADADDANYPNKPKGTAREEYDLLVSFFCMSEMRRETINAYLNKYIARSVRGYLQLNYDPPLSLDTKDGGNRGGEGALKSNYSPFDLLRIISPIHPSARLIPPPPCGTTGYTVGANHRLVWGPDVPRAVQEKKGDDSSGEEVFDIYYDDGAFSRASE